MKRSDGGRKLISLKGERKSLAHNLMNSEKSLQYTTAQMAINRDELERKGEFNAKETLPIIGHAIAWTI